MRPLALFILSLFLSFPAFAADKVAISGADGLKKGEERKLELRLTRDEKPLKAEDLKEVHKARLHLLVVDDSLTDYQHIHPEADKEPGLFTFSFTPQTAHNYTVWADITPVKGSHEYLGASLQGEEPCTACVDKKESVKAKAGDLQGEISFDVPLEAGEISMGTLLVSDLHNEGVTDLEPVMGAFSHIVGFYAAEPGVLHVHPMGDEPRDDAARGGPDLMFHIEPKKRGTIKLFAQVRRGGKDIFIPFTLDVR